MNSRKYPVLYLFILRRLKEKLNGKKEITQKFLARIINYTLMDHVPITIKYIFLKEMEEYGLIKKVNKHKYKITGKNQDLLIEKYKSVLW